MMMRLDNLHGKSVLGLQPLNIETENTMEIQAKKDKTPAFTKEQFFKAWVDSHDIKGWARFVGNIQNHAKDGGAKVPSDISVNMRLHKYTKEIETFGGKAPTHPQRPSKTLKVESKADFWARMGVLKTGSTF